MSLNRNPPSSLPDQLDNLALQTIDSLPDELLLPIFGNLSALERASILQICKKWNQLILLHTPFWQYLHLSENFSPSSIVRILSIFDERSGCRLKHVIIEFKITNVKHLNRIFVQLKRSGSSLNVLAVLQNWKLNGKTRALAMRHFPMLDSLITVADPALFRSGVAYTLEYRARLGLRDGSNDETGLRFFVTEALLELKQEDLRWISRLIYLDVDSTENIMSMRRILEATENLVELDLSSWTTLEEPSSSAIRSLSLKSEPVHLRSLKEVVTPENLELTSAMVQMLEIDGDQTILSGLADSLVLWKATGLRAVLLELGMYDREEQVETSVEKTRLLFQLNSAVESLTLRCYQGGYGGEQHHINKILELLDTSFQPQKSGMIAGREGDSSSGAVDNLLLPHLVKLTIEQPITLDGNLLQKIFKSRTERSSKFRLEFTDGDWGEVVVIDDWEARGWMN